MANITLYQLTEEMAAIEAILEENGGELTPELEERWAETSASLVAKADSYNALIVKCDNASTILGNEIKRLQSLKKTTDNTLKRVKEHIYNCMVQHGLKSVEGGLCKFTIAKNSVPSLKVDEAVAFGKYNKLVEELRAILPPYIKLDMSVDSAAVKDFYKSTGNVMPAGMEYEYGEHLVRK